MTIDEKRKNKVIVIGDELFGEILVKELFRYTKISILFVSSKNAVLQHIKTSFSSRVEVQKNRRWNKQTLIELFQQAKAVIVTDTSKLTKDFLILNAAIEAKIHYLDISNSCGYIEEVHKNHTKIREAGIAVFTGFSSTGICSLLMAKDLEQHFDIISEINTAHLLDNTSYQGGNLVKQIIERCKIPTQILEEGILKRVPPWSGRELFPFLGTIGVHNVYNINSPELFYFSRCYTLKRFSSKIGFESKLLNYLLELPSFIAAITHQMALTLASWQEQKPFSAYNQSTGSSAVGVRLRGGRWHKNTEVTAVFFAPNQTHRLIIFPVTLAVEYLLSGQIGMRGVINPVSWIGSREFFTMAKERGFQYLTKVEVK